MALWQGVAELALICVGLRAHPAGVLRPKRRRPRETTGQQTNCRPAGEKCNGPERPPERTARRFHNRGLRTMGASYRSADCGRGRGRAQLRALTFGGAVWDAFRENANCGDSVGTLWVTCGVRVHFAGA